MSVFVQTREVSVGDARYNLRPHMGEGCCFSCNFSKYFSKFFWQLVIFSILPHFFLDNKIHFVNS